MAMSIYDRRFFEQQEQGSKRSALKIAPLLYDLLQPRSVIDVGCGVGHWLSGFKQLGVSVAHGVDGRWVHEEQLGIPKNDFFVLDFASEPPPFSIRGAQPKYDLAISFEFLEHIDARIAPDAVKLLCQLSDVVAVGAAVPGQGGTHHVNEQWPDYWAGLFKENGYVACDILRPMTWSLPDVEYWYAQNIILYFKSRIPDHVMKAAESCRTNEITHPGRIVHPGLLAKKNDLRYHSIPELLRAIAGKIRRGAADALFKR